MELSDAVYNRRSIRKFADYFVTDEEIIKILDAARFAPSWANTQVWEFVVIRNRDLIRQITETYTPSNPARNCSFNSSVIIVACAKDKISGCRNGEERTKFSNWYMFDLGMSVQNLSLKAHELGLGSVIVGNLDHDVCNKILKLPENINSVAAIPVGKPEAIPDNPPRRKDLKEFVHLDNFGQFF